MKREILTYLYSFKNREYHELNEFIRNKGWEQNLTEVTSALQRAWDANEIEIANGERIGWGHMMRIESETHNTMATLDNRTVKARLSDTERDKWDEKNNETETKINELTLDKLQYERTIRDLEKRLSEAQLEDIPKNAEDRKTVIIWQIAAVVLGATAFLLKLFGVKGWL